ncbi:zinc-binding dehydrogenase [Actinospongicola halichondriae]|uniref:zinc-binding dehydrogenase n=1 Tax=Actinospongicola halichondriae TaxID=3236844 RepID=UPI003D4CC6DA
MRAAVLRDGQMVVADDVAEPEPGVGQVLVEVKACGICGSDLHFAKHGHTMLALGEEMNGMPDFGRTTPDLSRDLFMGHEFSAEVLEYGPDTEGPAPGSLVTSIPIMLTSTGLTDLAYTNDFPAGYSERMLLSAPMLVEVPNGLDATRAALTEPMAVGLHAVNRSGITERDGALVLGCGPVGLAVIAALRLLGVEAIVATDFSPARRALATTMGATEVVDPRDEPAFEAWRRAGGSKDLVVFEAIGVPGIINEVLRDAPPRSKIVVVGVCMEPDTITPYYGIGKELAIQFVLAYDPMEFANSLRSIAEGDIDVTPMITGEVGLDGVAGAFDDLGNPDEHCKIIVTP